MTEETNNVVPEQELARRRLVLESTENIIGSIQDIVDDVRDLREAGVPTQTWFEVLEGHISPEVRRSLPSTGMLVPIIEGLSQCFDGRPIHDVMNDLMISAISGAPMGSSSRQPAPEPKQEASLKDLHATPAEARMKKLITRMFEDAPKLKNPDGTDRADQVPAIEAIVALRTVGIPPVTGSLSTTPEGMLRMLSVLPKDGKMAEHFFDYADVVTIVLVRDLKATDGGSRIITS